MFEKILDKTQDFDNTKCQIKRSGASCQVNQLDVTIAYTNDRSIVILQIGDGFSGQKYEVNNNIER